MEAEAQHLGQVLEQHLAAAHELPHVPELLLHASREVLLAAYRQLHGAFLREQRKGCELARHVAAAHRLQGELGELRVAHQALQEAHALQVGRGAAAAAGAAAP
jgi:hypothetical protein